jgi:hypothetical protein
MAGWSSSFMELKPSILLEVILNPADFVGIDDPPPAIGRAERSLKPLKLPRLQASHPVYAEPGKLADMLLGGHAAASLFCSSARRSRLRIKPAIVRSSAAAARSIACRNSAGTGIVIWSRCCSCDAIAVLKVSPCKSWRDSAVVGFFSQRTFETSPKTQDDLQAETIWRWLRSADRKNFAENPQLPAITTVSAIERPTIS